MRSRRLTDQISGAVIKTASALVLIAVVSMFVQIFVVAYPLLESIEWRATTPATEAQSTLPNWIEQRSEPVIYRENARLRHSIIDAGGDVLAATLQVKEASPDLWGERQYAVSLPPEAVRAGSSRRVTILDGLKRIAVAIPSGTVFFIDVETGEVVNQIQTDRWEKAVLAADGRMIIQSRGRSLSVFQVSLDLAGKPVAVNLSEQILAAVPTGMSVSPDGLSALIYSAEEVLLWQLYSKEASWITGLQAVDRVVWTSPEHFKVLTTDGNVGFYRLKGFLNFSLEQLVQPQWRSGYAEPVFRWVPIVESEGDFPLFSLVPLFWGTLKAAFIALLFALPIGIPAAIFVGFYMSNHVRDRVKPVIELLAAIPTVVIGAIVAVAITPLFYRELAGLAGAVLAMPIGIVLIGSLASRRDDRIASRWQFQGLPLKMMPLVVALALLGWFLGKQFEWAFLGGDASQYLIESFGIALHQRNSLLLGFALGVALIPTIFTISEEAIHSVPRQLSAGSLALGASHWQSLRDVVLPLALPGVLAAVLMSFGRAVGETMIVIMVSGNSPLMDWDIFSGVRTLTATLALELPEASFNGMHYRVLFLAAFALFGFTFLVNTVAELARHRVLKMTTAWQS